MLIRFLGLALLLFAMVLSSTGFGVGAVGELAASDATEYSAGDGSASDGELGDATDSGEEATDSVLWIAHRTDAPPTSLGFRHGITPYRGRAADHPPDSVTRPPA